MCATHRLLPNWNVLSTFAAIRPVVLRLVVSDRARSPFSHRRSSTPFQRRAVRPRPSSNTPGRAPRSRSPSTTLPGRQRNRIFAPIDGSGHHRNAFARNSHLNFDDDQATFALRRGAKSTAAARASHPFTRGKFRGLASIPAVRLADRSPRHHSYDGGCPRHREATPRPSPAARHRSYL